MEFDPFNFSLSTDVEAGSFDNAAVFVLALDVAAVLEDGAFSWGSMLGLARAIAKPGFVADCSSLGFAFSLCDFAVVDF